MTPQQECAFEAQDYDIQRQIVVDTFNRHGHGPQHGAEVRRLSAIANRLHAAERRAGVPIGTTREGRR